MAYATREQWLNALAEEMAIWFENLGHKLPKFRVSVGFTSHGARGKRIGECWDGSCSADGAFEIFINPNLCTSNYPDVLAHELIHAAVGLEAGHGPKFRKVAKAIGLEGRMTATVPGEKFKAEVAPLLEIVGPIPHATLNTGKSPKKKQTTRLIKVCCSAGRCADDDSGTGYTIRMSQKWVDAGLPDCPICEEPMQVA
jgi:hypothetical protein